MGKIFVIMGKSATGKDTIFKALREKEELELKTVVTYTTRPIRDNEKDGGEYHFVTEEQMNRLLSGGKIIERRVYHTVHGMWHYFTADDGQIDLDRENYLVINTIEACLQLKEYYGEEAVVPLYIEVDDGIRLQRALDRERLQTHPKYAEMCRRFLADEKDFSGESLYAAGIKKVYENREIGACIDKIAQDIRHICAG